MQLFTTSAATAGRTCFPSFLTNGGPASESNNKPYRHSVDGRFVDVTAGSGLDFLGHCMGVAVADVNNDGRP